MDKDVQKILNESINEEVLPHNINKVKQLIDNIDKNEYFKIDGEDISVNKGFGTVGEQIDLQTLAKQFEELGFNVRTTHFHITVYGLKDFIEKQDDKNESINESKDDSIIDENEFTDRVDVDFNISLYDYGVVRNPKNDMTLIGIKPNNEGSYSDYSITYISLDDVKEVLEDMDDSFFRTIDSDKETVLQNLDNENLAQYIMDINFENGYWSDQVSEF